MSRRNAIIVTSRVPWPPDDGGRIAMWQNVAAAAREYAVTLLCLVWRTEETALPPDVDRLGIRVIRVPHRMASAPQALSSGLVGRWPYTLQRFRNEALERTVKEQSRALNPAWAMLTPLHMATYAGALEGVPIVIREHNVEHLWMRRYARRQGLTPRGIYARIQARRLLASEAQLCRKASLVLAIQEEEAKVLRRLVPGTRIEVLPIGVNLSDRAPHARSADAPHGPSTGATADEAPIVLLAGSYGWQPNRDGAAEFLREGWPRVLDRVPNARLRIVGKDLDTAAIQDQPGVERIGYVESMREEWARASVLVVPLWVGAGVRIKIIEAMAAGVPVAATRVAAAGLDLIVGEDYAAADTAAELGGQVAALLHNRSRRSALSERGRALAASRWSLDSVARLQNQLCREIAR